MEEVINNVEEIEEETAEAVELEEIEESFGITDEEKFEEVKEGE